MEIRRIEPLSLGKITGLIYAIIGFFWSILLLIGANVGGNTTGYTAFFSNQILPINIGWFIIIIGPLLYGIFGFISAVFFSWVYNLLAKKLGGVQIQ
ncbi:hypothetical protein HYV87_00130 [Candidatus Woesearchaeota archaeon]|nr:hypothetical protein [Candidatus Woesearchaeota archaeon]MBI2581521.1 hypothetical protein [Candidatus Woesearchaeota archaeon]